MNCLEFRRRLLADPFDNDEQLQQHETSCDDCGPFARDLRAKEVRLRSLLSDVTLPDGLVERVQLATHFTEDNNRYRHWWYSAAAAVLLGVAVSMTSVWTRTLERGHEALAESVVQHIEDESRHLHASGKVADNRLRWVFRRFGAELSGDLGTVSFAAECLMQHRNGVHLVLPGKMGPITVFFMPGETPQQITAVDERHFHGEILPTDWGSIAVVGNPGEPLDEVGARMLANVRWPTQADIAQVRQLNGFGARVAQRENR